MSTLHTRFDCHPGAHPGRPPVQYCSVSFRCKPVVDLFRQHGRVNQQTPNARCWLACCTTSNVLCEFDAKSHTACDHVLQGSAGGFPAVPTLDRSKGCEKGWMPHQVLSGRSVPASGLLAWHLHRCLLLPESCCSLLPGTESA